MGWYVGENKQATRVMILGGNQGDMVKDDAWFPTEGRSFGLLGYYWPKGVPLPEGDEGQPVILDDNGEPVGSAT